MDWDEAGAGETRHGQAGAEASGPRHGPVAEGAGAQQPSERVLAAAGQPPGLASEVEPSPMPKARAKAKPKAPPQEKKPARAKPHFEGVKRLRRDEHFHICAPECTTRHSLIQTFAGVFKFPMGWMFI